MPTSLQRYVAGSPPEPPRPDWWPQGGHTMARTIIVDGGQKIACPKCNHGFPLSEGISRQTIERYADDFERSLAEQKKVLERELVAEKERALSKFRSEELLLRRQLREL